MGCFLYFCGVFIEPIFLSTWGATVGKALLRISVRHPDGSVLNYSSALARTFDVWWRGLGAGFPAVSLVTLVIAWRTLNEDGITLWDKSGNLLVTHKRIGAVRVVVAILILFIFMIWIPLSGHL